MFNIMLYVKYIGTSEHHYVVYKQYNNDNIADIVTLIHRFADFIEGSPHLMPNEVSVHVQEYGFGGSFFEDEFFDTDDEEDEIKPMMKPEWDSTVFATHVNGNSYFISEWWAENSSQRLLCKVPDRLLEEGLRKAWIVASATRTTLSLGFQWKKKQSQAEQFGPICYQQKIVLFIECALKPDLFIFREQWLLLKLCFSDWDQEVKAFELVWLMVVCVVFSLFLEEVLCFNFQKHVAFTASGL